MRLALLASLMIASQAMADTPTTSGAPAPPPDISHARPLSIWRPALGGGLEHAQSGFICPSRLGDRPLNDAHIYDDVGLDVGCNFGVPPDNITVYATLSPTATPGAALTQAESDLVAVGATRHPTLLSRTTPSVGGIAWIVALYAEDGDLRSSIWMADLHGWLIEYRATYPAARETEVRAAIATMSGIVRNAAGARLDRCARSPAPLRDGVREPAAQKTGADALASAIIGAGEMAAAQDPKAQASARPITWCFEAAIRDPEHPLMLWRGVYDDGADAKADEVTLLTLEAPPTLDIASDPLSDLAEKAGKPRWTATMTDGDRTRVYGYFTGRPSGEAAATLLTDILAGNAKPLASYGVRGRTIIIGAPAKR